MAWVRQMELALCPSTAASSVYPSTCMWGGSCCMLFSNTAWSIGFCKYVGALAFHSPFLDNTVRHWCFSLSASLLTRVWPASRFRAVPLTCLGVSVVSRLYIRRPPPICSGSVSAGYLKAFHQLLGIFLFRAGRSRKTHMNCLLMW